MRLPAGILRARPELGPATKTEKAEPAACSADETISQTTPLATKAFRSRPAAQPTGSLDAHGSRPSMMIEIRWLGPASDPMGETQGCDRAADLEKLPALHGRRHGSPL